MNGYGWGWGGSYFAPTDDRGTFDIIGDVLGGIFSGIWGPRTTTTPGIWPSATTGFDLSKWLPIILLGVGAIILIKVIK